ncbi:putative phosphodiestherase [Acinetobacter phage Aristophanes]|uniref:Putative phosphodiestherase n=1 Tax=Acinetobacter phage Aristophanes TaxID=2759203 RepID=A0A7G9VYN5_BPACA|nr:putative phosphodiestherase [Acinetobacter phage Aristophanes]
MNHNQWKYDAISMYKAGKTYAEIAESLGKPYFTIATHLRRHLKSGKFDRTPNPASDWNWVQIEPPKRSRNPTIFVIGDTQCKQGIDLEYMHWIGAYIARKKPDIIVHLGDHYDMASLSTYDKSTLSAEGRRVQLDIEAGDEGLAILQQYIDDVPEYNPRKVVTLGNHEDRIDRFVSINPEFQGFLGTEKLAFHDLGWEVIPFLKPINICGINFVHYLANTMTGRPLGGSALNRLKQVGESYVMGHQQVFDYAERPLQLSGKKQLGIIVGACYNHDEGYKGYRGNHHFRGCVMLYECSDGYALHKNITLQHMQNLYEGTTV